MSGKTAVSSSGKRRAQRSDPLVDISDEEAIDKEPSGSFAWKFLLPSQIRSLSQCPTPEELEQKMGIVLKFDHHSLELREACQLDVFVISYHWAKEQGFDERQLSGFITLLHHILENVKSNMSKAGNFQYMKECFSGVGSDNPDLVPIPLYFFKLEHSKLIIKYLISTIFQHYSLYQYLYYQQQDELIIGTDMMLETCPVLNSPYPVPLEEGMPLEMYEEHLIKKESEKLTDDEETDDATADNLIGAVMDAMEASGNDVVKTVSTSELRGIIERVTKEMILPAKTELKTKIKEKEQSYLNRIGKIHVK
nr:ciliary-associated calcium-binding coiled-coil protein 1-like [Ciona intestinalis]|eukprot:XP_002126324.1 ciliary-associated calcium-binding coiled-coil protein 1-like [Ciona intestinalis]